MFWFNDAILTTQWFQHQFERARSGLGERYTPGTNVELPIRQAIIGCRNHSVIVQSESRHCPTIDFVKHIVREAGYHPVDTGIKLPNDPVFSSGTRYSKRAEAVHRSDEGPLLERFVATLSSSELRELRELVATGIP